MERLILTPGVRRQAILDLLRSARSNVVFSLFRCDDSRVLDEIVATARRGVDVKVLITPKARGWTKRLGGLTTLLKDTGVTVKQYDGPWAKYHAKYIVRDGEEAAIGTLNLTRKCFDNTCDFLLHSHDTHVVAGLTALFESDWSTPDVSPPALEKLIIGPDQSRHGMLRVLAGAKARIRIIDHRVSHPEVLLLIARKMLEGVRVQILGRGETGNLWAHGKLFLIDDDQAVIGSASLSRAGLEVRREVSVIVSDPAIVGELSQFFDALVAENAARSRSQTVRRVTRGQMMTKTTTIEAARIFALLALFLFPAALLAQNPNDEPADDAIIQDSGRPWQLSFKNRPSLRLGEFTNIELKTKFHFDFRGFDPNSWNAPGQYTVLPSTPPTFYVTRSFVGLKGQVTKRVTFEVERDFRQTFGSDHEWHPWKNNDLDIHVMPLLNVQVGKFKLPYGMESNLSEDRLDFAFKSRVSDLLAPARQRGVMVHSKFLKNDRMEYKVGVFRYDGEATDIHGAPTGKKTVAGAITGEPLRYLKRLPIPKTIRHTYLGFAATQGGMIEGQNGVHGSTFSNFTYFDHLYVNGNRTRLGAEMSWTEGPFGIKGEYMHMSEERKQEGIRGQDLPDEISRGWYLMGSWNVFGKMKSSGKPKTPFLTKGGRGFGAIELVHDTMSSRSTARRDRDCRHAILEHPRFCRMASGPGRSVQRGISIIL